MKTNIEPGAVKSEDYYLEFVKTVFCTVPLKKTSLGENVYPAKELVRELIDFWMMNPFQKHEYIDSKKSMFLKTHKTSGSRKKNKGFSAEHPSPYTGESVENVEDVRNFYDLLCDQVGDWFLVLKNPETFFYNFFSTTLYGNCELEVSDEGVWICKNKFYFIPLWYISMFPRAVEIYTYWLKNDKMLFKTRTYDFYSPRLTNYVYKDRNCHLPVECCYSIFCAFQWYVEDSLKTSWVFYWKQDSLYNSRKYHCKYPNYSFLFCREEAEREQSKSTEAREEEIEINKVDEWLDSRSYIKLLYLESEMSIYVLTQCCCHISALVGQVSCWKRFYETSKKNGWRLAIDEVESSSKGYMVFHSQNTFNDYSKRLSVLECFEGSFTDMMTPFVAFSECVQQNELKKQRYQTSVLKKDQMHRLGSIKPESSERLHKMYAKFVSDRNKGILL